MERIEDGTETTTELDREHRGQGIHGDSDAGGGGKVILGIAGDYEGLVQAIIDRISRDSAERLGKILDQLIKQEREKLAEAAECIRWYEREVEKHSASIKELEDLRSSLSE